MEGKETLIKIRWKPTFLLSRLVTEVYNFFCIKWIRKVGTFCWTYSIIISFTNAKMYAILWFLGCSNPPFQIEIVIGGNKFNNSTSFILLLLLSTFSSYNAILRDLSGKHPKTSRGYIFSTNTATYRTPTPIRQNNKRKFNTCPETCLHCRFNHSRVAVFPVCRRQTSAPFISLSVTV